MVIAIMIILTSAQIKVHYYFAYKNEKRSEPIKLHINNLHEINSCKKRNKQLILTILKKFGPKVTQNHCNNQY